MDLVELEDILGELHLGHDECQVHRQHYRLFLVSFIELIVDVKVRLHDNFLRLIIYSIYEELFHGL